jgi:Lipid A 3-O-deacylase (PagL)
MIKYCYRSHNKIYIVGLGEKLFLVLVIHFIFILFAYSQEVPRNLRLGFNYEIGNQQFFPFDSPDYSYKVNGYKLFINYPLKNSGKFRYELQLEPGIYSSQHKLLNEFYVQPKEGSDYLEQREIFTKDKSISEYVFNVGLIFRYIPKDKLSFFVLGSIGPMFGNKDTERLARGFAFSDIVTLGVGYKVGKTMFEVKSGLRHNSNANIQLPNSGHNSTTIDFGISRIL